MVNRMQVIPAQNRTGSLAEMPVIVGRKGIAKYMNKGIRTVQRWELEFGLPVRRSHAKQRDAQVRVVPAELREWVKSFPFRFGLLSPPRPEVGNLLENIFQLE